MSKYVIQPPNDCDLQAIKHDLKKINSGYVDIATYPNGVEVVIVSINNEVTVSSSKPLIKIDDFTYQVPN